MIVPFTSSLSTEEQAKVAELKELGSIGAVYLSMRGAKPIGSLRLRGAVRWVLPSRPSVMPPGLCP